MAVRKGAFTAMEDDAKINKEDKCGSKRYSLKGDSGREVRNAA
jgi:hypothetical protein